MRNPLLRSLRATLMSQLLRIPALQQAAISGLAEDGISYPNSSLAKSPPITAATATDAAGGGGSGGGAAADAAASKSMTPSATSAAAGGAGGGGGGASKGRTSPATSVVAGAGNAGKGRIPTAAAGGGGASDSFSTHTASAVAAGAVAAAAALGITCNKGTSVSAGVVTAAVAAVAAVAVAAVAVLTKPSGTASTLSPAQRAVYGIIKPGMVFPDVSVMINGVRCAAVDMLRGKAGTFGCLVILAGDGRAFVKQQQQKKHGFSNKQQQQQQQKQEEEEEGDMVERRAARLNKPWPLSWGQWPLHVVQVVGSSKSLGFSATTAPGQGLHTAAGGGDETQAAAEPATGAGEGVKTAAAAAGEADDTSAFTEAPHSKGAGPSFEVEDSWGLLAAAAAAGDGEGATTGVLVRPDGMVAAVGGPEVIRAWLAYHVV